MKTESLSTWHQPALNRPGEIVEDVADITQCLHIILQTPCGSDPHRSDFGSRLHDYLDNPIDTAIPHVVRETIDAITRWEPRCQQLSVTPQVQGEKLTLTLTWKTSQAEHSTEVVWR